MFPSGLLLVILFLNYIGDIILCTVILVGLQGLKINLDGMGGYSIPEGCITKFHGFEVYINNDIVDLDGVCI